MAEKYQDPQLCNYFCVNECEIGKQYVPEVKIKDLSQIVLEMLASLNSVKKRQERISLAVEALQLWAEKKIASGDIDMEAYNAAKCRKNNLGKNTVV